MTTGWTLKVGVATAVGRVRERNEDALHAGERLFVVADGMGGHAAGDVASALTVAAFAEVSERESLAVDDLLDRLEVANDRILAAAQADPDCFGMATTVTGVGIVQHEGASRWVVFNLGDSRVYRYAEHELTRVTVDHSQVQELLDAGLLTESQARVHPLRHTVTRSLGRDYLPPIDTWLVAPSAGERFLVCSDGLTNELEDPQIGQILGDQADPQGAADALVRAAVANGGRDNVTVIVVDNAR